MNKKINVYWMIPLIIILLVAVVGLIIKYKSDATGAFGTPVANELTFCGNGRIESGEQCDDGNSINEYYLCGNGILENGNWCSNDCKVGGLAQEECDDGNTVNEDKCSSTCTIETMQNSTG